jgi:hypothetical protein
MLHVRDKRSPGIFFASRESTDCRDIASRTSGEPEEDRMESLLGGLSFAALVGGWALAVIAVHNLRWEDPGRDHREPFEGAFVRNIWLLGGV